MLEAFKGRACPQSISTAPLHPATAPAAVPAGQRHRAPAALEFRTLPYTVGGHEHGQDLEKAD